MASSVRNMAGLLTSLVDRTEGETVSVRDLINAVGRRAYGPLLLLVGVVGLSPLTVIPGASWFVALLTLLIAGQAMIGLSHPWVPQKLLDVSFPRPALVRGVDAMTGFAHRMDKLTCPRLPILTESPFLQVVAGGCVVAALITFPLGFVPFGPLLPCLAITMIGLGITSRDGFVVLLSGATLFGAAYLLWRFWPWG